MTTSGSTYIILINQYNGFTKHRKQFFSKLHTRAIKEKIHISEIIQSSIQSLSDDKTSMSERSESFIQHPTFDQSLKLYRETKVI